MGTEKDRIEGPDVAAARTSVEGCVCSQVETARRDVVNSLRRILAHTRAADLITKRIVQETTQRAWQTASGSRRS